MPYKNPEDKKKYMRKWNKLNSAKKTKHRKETWNDDYYSVYLLPNENYVGQTKCVRMRMHKHKSDGNNIEDYKILHTFSTREEALEKEAEYHSKGYKGKHLNIHQR